MNVVETQLDYSGVTPADHEAERNLVWDIPLGDTYIALLLRLSGTMTVGVAPAASLQAGGIERIIRSLELVADWKGPGLDSLIRSYVVQGVNDAIAGRTISYGGRLLALENLIDSGTPIQKSDPGLGIAANAFEAVFALRFETPRSARPLSTLLNSGLLKRLTLKVKTGILDTTAAGDDTDVYVTAPTTTVVTALSFALEAVALRDPPARVQYNLRRVRSLEKTLSVNDRLALDLGEKAFYRRLLCIQLDNDVLSDARATEVKVRIDKHSDITDRTWASMQGQAKERYRLASMPSGMNVVDFRGVLGTMRAHSVDLVLKVPAGAVVAEDKLLVGIEDVVFNPARATDKADQVAPKGRQLARGRRR